LWFGEHENLRLRLLCRRDRIRDGAGLSGHFRAHRAEFFGEALGDCVNFCIQAIELDAKESKTYSHHRSHQSYCSAKDGKTRP